jgi:hypothetical protein
LSNFVATKDGQDKLIKHDFREIEEKESSNSEFGGGRKTSYKF